ncbi:HTTM domain-containing protein [Mesonia maritima]|uniref:HTTM-like domain-containing protein n=1 Tax=Mesonia maritima TaxID=1793873 RepID=A0ABU1K2U0_9FLAO|nr:HTTM domain-containing protein [Mesonia maritima]MDR6299929.1 hypothetical protein [Mesonia maritima]
MLQKWLFKQVDSSALIVFRVCFGLLITIEAWGAIFTGWIRRTLIEPTFTFNFIGLDFLQPLPGNGMYYYYAVMGLFGVFVTLGYKYRFSMASYTLMWSCVYFMQKSSYNNHYYLLILICIFMLIVPAHRYFSVDVKQKPALKKFSMPNWVNIFIILQLWIVYTYASVAKLYPDWLDGTVPALLMKSKQDYWLIGDFLQNDWVPGVITYFGLIFDLIVVPCLLWKPTRKPIFIAAIFFHLFNSIVFQIGIFPYLSLAFCLFFFPAKSIQQRFLPKKKFYELEEVTVPNYKPALVSFFVIWFLLQLCLPLRHWFIPDNVLWTEEGHRLSWRMMLRSKSGHSTFTIVDNNTGKKIIVPKRNYLSKKQMGIVSTKPDVIWQFCQRLKKEYEEKGEDISIYVNAKVRVNNRPSQPLIDPNVDMAKAEWNYFSHNDWILPSNLEKSKK